MAIALTPTQVLTGKVRFSFLHVFEPAETLNKGTFKYSVQLLISKTDKKTVDSFNAAYKAAFEIGQQNTFKGGKAAEFKSPLRDGDVEFAEDIKAGKTTYKGMYFVNASSSDKYAPTVMGPDGTKLMDRTDIYSGCYGRAFVNLYPYCVSGNKGIACGLSGVQLLEQGESLGGGTSAAAVFTEIHADDEI